ncbi:MAG TPA: DNA internalization-related competence protein ComEC/Rec2, partial [Gemmatimonadales bacterium]|nr:DNA internalization-related competence protein ComEC/Rec2 [Gemmatimonadales bacterium]
RPLGSECDDVVRARWPRDTVASAGTIATVRARWQPRSGILGRPEGLLRISRIEQLGGSASPLARSRQVVAVTSQRLFGSRAGRVDALVSGRTGGIDFEVRDRFAAAGLIHILSISGFHVGLIAFWLVLLLRAAGLTSRHAELAAMSAVLGYTAWLGWPAPATRAAALFAAIVLSRRRQRSVRPDGLLGASALVVLAIDPWSVADLGAWLSFAAMAGLLWGSGWYRRNFEHSTLGDALAGSLGATLATAPIAAATIGRVAAIGPAVNLVALPLAAIAVPTVLAAVVTGILVPGLAGGFAAAATVLLALLDRIAMIGASLPGAAGAARAGFAVTLPWVVLLAVALHATRGGTAPLEALRRCGWSCALIVWATLLTGPVRAAGSDGRLTLHFLDVGQGDAAAIRTPDGNWVLVDAGPADQGFDAGERVVLPFLARQGARQLRLMVVSHAHRDHVGGAAAVMAGVGVEAVLEPGEPFDDGAYLEWLNEVAERDIPWLGAVAGMHWQIDGVDFTVLHPRAGGSGRSHDLNEDSVVLLIRYGEFAALFTGDAGLATESWWRDSAGDVDLLKVGHHGSAGSSGDELLESITPLAAVISSGRNGYGHPSPRALRRLAAAGTAIWRTDREGTISVSTDGQRFTIRGGRTTATFVADHQPGEDTSCCMPPR